MAALREWHSTRDGMGHANRSRLDDAFSVDAKPWRVRLSSGWRIQSDSNANGIAKSDGDGDGNCDANSNSSTKAFSYAKTTPVAAAAAIAHS